MAYSLVAGQRATASGKSVTSSVGLTLTFTNNTAAGNLVVLIHSGLAGSGAVVVNAVTGMGATWTKLVGPAPGTSNDDIEIWAAVVVTPGKTVNVTYTSTSDTACEDIMEFAPGAGNTATVTTDGTNAHAQASGTTVAPGSITTTDANDLVVAGCCVTNTGAVTTPGGSWTFESSFGTAGGSGASNLQAASAFQVPGATGSFNPAFGNATNNGNASAAIAAIKLQPAATASLPPPVRHPEQRERSPRVRAKRFVRANPQFLTPPTPPFPNFPEQIRRRGQARRTPNLRPKKSLRAHLNPLLIPPRPFPEWPLTVHHARGQTKRTPHNKPKRVTRSSIQLRIPPRPFPEFPAALRHAQQQKRVPRVKPKKPERFHPLGFLPPLPLEPPAMRHPGQKRRVPKVTAKKPLRANLSKQLIPPRPFPEMPPAMRHPAGQRRRTPNVKPKRVTRNSNQLRIPQAPAVFTPQMPVLGLKRQAKRIPRVKSKRSLANVPHRPIQSPLTPPALRHQGQKHRVGKVKTKASLRASLTKQLIPPAPLAIFPIGLRRAQQKKRIVRARPKRVGKNSNELRIPQAAPPPVIANLSNNPMVSFAGRLMNRF